MPPYEVRPYRSSAPATPRVRCGQPERASTGCRPRSSRPRGSWCLTTTRRWRGSPLSISPNSPRPRSRPCLAAAERGRRAACRWSRARKTRAMPSASTICSGTTTATPETTAAMDAYLRWETELPTQIAADGRAGFDLRPRRRCGQIGSGRCNVRRSGLWLRLVGSGLLRLCAPRLWHRDAGEQGPSTSSFGARAQPVSPEPMNTAGEYVGECCVHGFRARPFGIRNDKFAVGVFPHNHLRASDSEVLGLYSLHFGSDIQSEPSRQMPMRRAFLAQ